MSDASTLRVHPSTGSRPSALSTIVPITSVRAKSLTWLMPGRILEGTICIIEGDPNAGKSCLLAEIVATITTGRAWLGRPKSKPRGALWLSADEDPATMIGEIWQRLGLDPDHPLQQTETTLTAGSISCTIAEAAGVVTVTRQ